MSNSETYKVRAQPRMEIGQVGQNGTEAVQVDCVVEEGDQTGVVITWRGWLTDKAQERTLKTLRAMGWTGRSFTDESGLGDVVFTLVVTQKEEMGANGRMYENTDVYVPLAGDGLKRSFSKPMDASRKELLSRKLGSVLDKLDAIIEGDKSNPSRSEPAPNDDIPF